MAADYEGDTPSPSFITEKARRAGKTATGPRPLSNFDEPHRGTQGVTEEPLPATGKPAVLALLVITTPATFSRSGKG